MNAPYHHQNNLTALLEARNHRGQYDQMIALAKHAFALSCQNEDARSKLIAQLRAYPELSDLNVRALRGEFDQISRETAAGQPEADNSEMANDMIRRIFGC